MRRGFFLFLIASQAMNALRVRLGVCGFECTAPAKAGGFQVELRRDFIMGVSVLPHTTHHTLIEAAERWP